MAALTRTERMNFSYFIKESAFKTIKVEKEEYISDEYHRTLSTLFSAKMIFETILPVIISSETQTKIHLYSIIQR